MRLAVNEVYAVYVSCLHKCYIMASKKLKSKESKIDDLDTEHHSCIIHMTDDDTDLVCFLFFIFYLILWCSGHSAALTTHPGFL